MDGDSEKARILVVDDALPTIELIQTVLEGQGYEVMVATSGEQAVKKAGLKAPDLILLDVLMPGMGGFETCRRLKAEERTRDIPVIFMTALTTVESKVRGFEVGGVDYVSKPGEVEEVLARVRTHLSLRNMRLELETQNRRLQQEIAERKAAQEALKANEERYRTLIESSSDAILVLDPDRRVLSCNQAFLDLFGYGRSEVEGRSIRIIHPSDESYHAFGDKIYPVIKDVNTCRTEWDFVHKDGTPFPVETVTSAMRSSDGSVRGYVAIIRDVTERRLMEDALRESEQRLRMIIDAMPVLIHAHDAAGDYVFWNKECERVTGYTSEEIVGNPRVRELIYPDPEERKVVEGYHRTILDFQEWECVTTARDGSRKIIAWTSRSTYSPIPGWLSWETGVDMTDRKRMEDSLRESEERFRILAERSLVGVYLIQDNLFRYVNPAFAAVLGYGREEIIDRLGPEDFLTLEDRELVMANITRRTSGDLAADHLEFRVGRKDGAVRDVEVFGSRLVHKGRPAILGTLIDITERRRAEQALKASEERYRELFDNAPVGYHEIDMDGRITRVNCTELDMLGYTAQDMLGRYVWEFIIEEISHSQVKGKLTGEIPVGLPFERTYRRKDGAPVPVLVEDRLVRNYEGQVTGIRLTIQDITERKRVQAALLESEAQKRAILDASIDRIRYVDRDMRIIWANKTTASSLNMPPEQLVGKTCHKALRGRDTHCVGCPTVRARETGRVERAVLYQPVPGGTEGGTYWDNYCVPLKNEDGEIIGFVQVARNITAQRRVEEALRESEARYRALVEQIPAITYAAELDEASTTLYISPQIEGIIGFTQTEYSRDPDIWRKQLHPEDRGRVLAEVARSHETGEPLRTEYRILHRNGHVVWLRDEALIVKDSSGRPLHLQGVMFDISGAKQAEEQIHVLSQELMKAHEKERQMISLELHDRVAQDLSTVKIGLDTLLFSQPEASPETKSLVSELSGIIQGSITAVRDLVYDLRPPSLDQLGLVQSIYQYCEDFSGKTGLIVDFASAGIDDLRLDSDTEINLHRLVQEALINVRKHAEAAHVVLRLVASFPDVILRITDDGKGFDVEERRQSLTQEKRMGLRSMEERVRWLGGTMDVKSSPGRGTRIVISIPHKEKDRGPEEDPADRG